MARHLLTPLALLGLLVALVKLGAGSADQYEDYYMQELLTREQHMLEKPVASTPDRQDPAKRLPARRAHKGAVAAKPGIKTHYAVSIPCATLVCTAVKPGGAKVNNKSRKKSINIGRANGCWREKDFFQGKM